MNRVRIVTDSIADIPVDLTAELDISVVPCLVHVGQDTYLDGVDLSPQAFYEKLAASPELPRTSQPPLSSFVDTYRRLLDEDNSDGILSIHVGRRFSGVVNAAWAAAQMLPEPSRVEVIDSEQLSMGQGWSVIEAARMAKAGASRAEISRAVQALLPRLRVAAMIDTLDNLYKGGRISVISATLGTVLQVKPLLHVERGVVTVFDKVRIRAKALGRLVNHIRAWGQLTEVAVLHTGAEELAEDLAGMLQDLAPAQSIIIEPAGSALATHLGLGAVGACALLAAEGADPQQASRP